MILFRSNVLSVWPIGAIVIGLVVVGLSTLGHWEMSTESWGYWFFARIFLETGEFVNPDRSPLYVLYLGLFRWMGFPTSVTVEYVVTGLLVFVAMVAFLRTFVGTWFAILISVAWVPFIQTSEPTVQKLALGASLMGMVFRGNRTSRFGLVLSYASFGLAYLFRSSYIALLIIFVVYDLIRLVRGGKLNGLMDMDWRRNIPIASVLAKGCFGIALMAIFMWFHVAQSPHPWNNGWFASTRWFPVDNVQSLTDGHFIQAWNWKYIEYKYGSHEGKDFYFTNQELFGGASDLLGAVMANPEFVVRDAIRSIKPAIHSYAKTTELRLIPTSKWFEVVLPLFLLFGAISLSRDPEIKVFVIACVVITIPSVIVISTPRLYIPVIPVAILGSTWIALKFKDVLDQGSFRIKNVAIAVGLFGLVLSTLYFFARVHFLPQPGYRTLYAVLVCYSIAFLVLLVGWVKNDRANPRMIHIAGCVAMAIPLILFTNGVTSWSILAKDLIRDVIGDDVRMLQRRGNESSMKMAYPYISNHLDQCDGIMSAEHLFIGAFTDFDVDRVYDIFEIPPFGQLGNDQYHLDTRRVDCVFVSNYLATAVGHATNVKLRYENYVIPYVEGLVEIGAKRYKIPDFGELIILNHQ